MIYVFSVVGILLSMLLNSILVEQRYKKEYGGEWFTYWTTMILMQSTIMVVTAFIFKLIKKEKLNKFILNKNLM